MEYVTCIKPISANELLRSFTVTSFSDYKKEYQKKLIREAKADIRSTISRPVNIRSASDIANELARKLRHGH